MRGPTGVLVACLTLALLASGGGARAAEREPVTGGLLPPPGSTSAEPPPAPEDMLPPEPLPHEPPPPPRTVAEADGTAVGLIARYGYFGLPDAVADHLFNQHPEVDGTIYGGEVRIHGAGGGRGVFSLGFGVDYGETSAYGIWQTDDTSAPQAGSGEISMLALTVTGYWNIVPSGAFHPYLGFGLGFGYFKGTIQEEADLVKVETLLPVLHVPVGVAFEFGEHLQFALEARIINGIAAGGALQLRF